MTDRLPVNAYHQLVVLRRRELIAEAERDRLARPERPVASPPQPDAARIVRGGVPRQAGPDAGRYGAIGSR